MIATSAPFSQYFDKNGDPLDSGFVYFGVPDANPETSPIPAYWDEAGTQPVAQPARTLAGYIVRNGTPARVYVEGAYSQTVKNKKGELVYYAANSEDYSNLPVNVATIEATAGQTNVNLPFSYTRGNNSLAVYLNGTLLLKDRDYIETSETSIQMFNPLKIGPGGADEVTAIGGRLINPSSAIGTVSAAALAAGSGAGLVGYDASLTFPAGTVGSKIARSIVDVMDFFVAGEADQTAAWNRAVALLNAGTVTALAVCGLTVVNGAINPITRSGSAIYTFSGSGGTSGIRQLSATANTLVFSAANPEADRINDISIHNLAIWNGSGAPSAGAALTMVRAGRARISGLDIRNHFVGLDVLGGGDCHITNSTIAGFFNWGAVATGSRCARFRIASYGATNEVPSEWFITNFNWKGVTQSGPVNYLDIALDITAGDGLWFNNGHVGFSNNASCRVYQNAAVGYIADVEFCKVYFDGNRAGDATSGVGALVDGLSGNITGVRFLGCINKGHQSHGYNFIAPNAQRIQVIGGGVEANGRAGVVIDSPVNTSVALVDFANNNRLNTTSPAIAAASSSGVKLLGNTIDVFATYPHPVGISIGTGCANVQVCDNTFDDAIADPMSFAACSTLTYRGNRLQGGNPTAFQTGAVLYLPTGFETVLVPDSGGVSVTSINGPNNYGAEVRLVMAGATTMVSGSNIGLSASCGDFTSTAAGAILSLLNNGTAWFETGRAGAASGDLLGTFTWANRPSASANIGKRFIASDIGAGGYAEFRSDGTLWRVRPGTHLSHTVTPVVGAASASLQLMGTSQAIPRGVLEGCRRVSVVFQLSKSGTTDNVTTTMYCGPLGTSSDTLVYSTGAFLAANRQYSGGLVQRYQASPGRMITGVAAQNVAPETGTAATGAWPIGVTATMADVNQFYSVYAQPAGASDIPTCESFSVIAG